MAKCKTGKAREAPNRAKKRDQSGNREVDGRFKPGHKLAGPGRREGSRNKATLLLEDMLADDGEAVVRSVIEAAKDGDMQAARMVLDRIVPPRKGRSVKLAIPAIETADGVLTAISATIKAMGEGDLTPDEAATVAGVLESKRKAIETVEIEARLSALEQRSGLKRSNGS